MKRKRVTWLLRTHDSSLPASVQSLMPLEETVTTVRIGVRKKTLAIHEVRTVANVKEDKACRTKLAVQADAENYNFDKFGWHWITVRGDFRKEVLNLTLL